MSSAGKDPVLTAFSMLPWVGLAVLYSFVVRARLLLGEWPQPYRPDPKELGFALHHGATVLLLEAAVMSPVALLVWALLRRGSRMRGRPVGMALATFAAGYAALWLLLLTDLGSCWEWFFD